MSDTNSNGRRKWARHENRFALTEHKWTQRMVKVQPIHFTNNCSAATNEYFVVTVRVTAHFLWCGLNPRSSSSRPSCSCYESLVHLMVFDSLHFTAVWASNGRFACAASAGHLIAKCLHQRCCHGMYYVIIVLKLLQALGRLFTKGCFHLPSGRFSWERHQMHGSRIVPSIPFLTLTVGHHRRPVIACNTSGLAGASAGLHSPKWNAAYMVRSPCCAESLV